MSQHLSVVAQLTSPGAPFEVERKTINGREVLAYKNARGSLADIINQGRQHGDKTYLQYQGDTWSFDRFFKAVDNFATILQGHYHLKQGDRIAIAMRNRPEWLAAFCAIVNIGAVAVPLNSWGKAEELHQGLKDSRAKFVMCDEQRHTYIQPEAFGIDALLVDPTETQDKRTKHCSDFAQTAHDLSPVEIKQEDEAIVMFTSGTGGRPKGAVFSHFNCVQALFNIDFIGASTYMTHTERMNLLLAGPPSKTLFAVPLFHISGLFSQAIANLKGGRSLYMMYKWDADDAIRAMRDEGVTILMGAPTMMLDVLKHPELAKIDVSNISNISAAGAATPPSLFKLFREKMPDTMAGAGWGLTETAGTGAAYTGQAFAENPTSSGFVSPIVEMKFINEAGEVITDGSPGEIYIKTAACVDHYDSGGNDEDFPDGWFKTGDVGYKDANGLLYLCDRVKDMIIRGGENIYPVEVENCLITHPNCVEAAVLGIADENYGEKVVAVVVCKDPNTADGESFIAHCKSHLAAYKVPTEIVFSDSALPRNPTKKLLKKQIKQAFFA